MKKILITIGIALMLSMIGCSQEPQNTVSDSTTVIESQKEMVREEPESKSEKPVHETQKMEDPKSEESKAEKVVSVVTEQPKAETKKETMAKEEPVYKETPRTESEPGKTPTVETEKVETTETKETESKETTSEEPQTETVTKEMEKEQVVNFDMSYWISFAKSYAIGRGLVLDTTATECWDNPITADSSCRYLERDIKDRLDYYVDVEGFESVWIWYEEIGDNKYLIYIGYA